MPFKCCVHGCKYEGKNGFHSIPADHSLATKWIEFSGAKLVAKCEDQPSDKSLSHSYYQICKKHFKPTDYDTNVNGGRRLKKGTVPSLCFPNVLLSVEREHDYILPPRKRKRVEEYKEFESAGINSGQGNDIHTLNIRADFCDKVNVGAYEDAQLDEIVENPERHATVEEVGSGANVAKELEARCGKCSKMDEWTNDNVVKYLSNKFNKQQLEIFKIQIFNAGKKINGRRYTDDQKSLALCMYKQSPKKYRFLRRFMTLPGKSTLGRHRAHLVFQSGIDPKLMGLMKLKANDMSEEDKLSVLVWDEVSLHVFLDYKRSRDLIDGFVDMNGLRRPDFATHSLTYMVRGIQTTYKEPVALYYTANLKSVELSGMVRVTAEAVLNTGLNLIGSVCDQPAICAAAVHDLIAPGATRVTPTGELLQYTVKDHVLSHVYDYPHIWKVLRNNLMVKDLCHTLTKRWEVSGTKNFGTVKRYATWDHIIQLYDLDKSGTHRLAPKLTPEHMKPDKEKMKVSNATQVFSATVGNVMLSCSEKGQLPANAEDTALVLLFFNDLFDSLNGCGFPQYESLKGSIDAESFHFAYWNYALSVLADMNFVDKSTRRINNDSTVLKKLESTIRGYIKITRICLKSSISEVALRNTNQDGLENFFGCCKGLCGAKPIASHYRSAYTTMITNNLIGPVSQGSNCEEDKFFPLLSNINNMLLDFNADTLKADEADENNRSNNDEIVNIDSENEKNMLDTIVFSPFFGDTEFNFIETESISDTSSAICRKLMEKTSCDDCRITLKEPLSDINSNNFDIILPSVTFRSHFEKLFRNVMAAIPYYCREINIKQKITSQIEGIEGHAIGCHDHSDEMADKLKDLIINYALIAFCNNINNILSGKVKELPEHFDHMQAKAFEFRQKKRGIGKHSDKFIE